MVKKTSKTIVENLCRELKRHDLPENRSDYQRFHKEKLKEPVGLKTPVLRSISKVCYSDLRQLPAKEILNICDDLLASGHRYMRFFAFDWASKVNGDYAKTDFRRFERWLKQYVNGWGSCDHLCCGALGDLLVQYPDMIAKTKRWTESKSQWLRRAAAVCLINSVHNRAVLKEIFDTADRLLIDEEDLVQKGCGWMLKEASNVYRDEVFAYVMKNRTQMPRTALRYAVEKMPATMRKRAMAR